MESYLFCHRLGHGGMAEAFLALQRGIEGFEKLVVVKRMHPHLRYDEQLVRLFVNEARLAATIRHPNVVQMLNIRRNERELFIIMEYLSGESTQTVLRQARKRHEQLPIPIACKIGADIAAGLHAGHSVAIGGKARPVIHRDVTPSNIFVGYDGLTRLLDFGIAEGLRSNAPARQLRGKLGYIAPEQLKDGYSDQRSDIWQLGSVLFELVTGERLYDAATMPTLREKMKEPTEPLKRLRPDAPGLLDATVRSALEIDPDNRPQTALELRDALLHIGSAYGQENKVGDVAGWMLETVPELFDVRQRFEQRASAGVVDDADLEFLSTLIPKESTSKVSTDEHLPDTGSTLSEQNRELSPFVVVALVAVLALLFVAVIAIQRVSLPASTGNMSASEGLEDDETARFRVEVKTEPETASIYLDGRRVGTGEFSESIARDGSRHTLVVSAEGFLSRVVVFKDSAPEPVIVLKRDAAESHHLDLPTE